MSAQPSLITNSLAGREALAYKPLAPSLQVISLTTFLETRFLLTNLFLFFVIKTTLSGKKHSSSTYNYLLIFAKYNITLNLWNSSIQRLKPHNPQSFLLHEFMNLKRLGSRPNLHVTTL